LSVVAVSLKKKDDEIVLSGEPMQQRLERGEQGHEEGRSALAAERAQRLGERPADPEWPACSAVTLERRARAVGRQNQDRCVLEDATPIGELFGDRIAAEPFSLPDGI